MYSVEALQEKLEQAKGHLREVDDHLLKVDGKPANSTQRYQKPEFRQVPSWGNPKRHDHDNDENMHAGNLGRKVLKTVLDDTQRREFGGGSRRSQVSASEFGQQRKRMLPALDNDEDPSPARKKVFQSVGKMPNPGKGFAHPRNVFSRLSGPVDEEMDEPDEEEVEEEEEEIVMKRPPIISSKVEAIERPTPSREEVIASQKQDEVRKQRDKRMFGALVGTLQQFRRDESKVQKRDERRLQIEKKLEEDAKKDKEKMFEEKRQLQIQRKRKESDIKRIEWSLNRVKEFDAWKISMLPLKNFIQTKGEPKIFYLPKKLSAKTEILLEESVITVQGIIDKRSSLLNEEIETSERKAKRLIGEEDDINKENMEVTEDSHKDAEDTTIYGEHQVKVEKTEIKIASHDKDKRIDKDLDKNGDVTDRNEGKNKNITMVEKATSVSTDLNRSLKPQLPMIPTELVSKSKSPVHDVSLDISKNEPSPKEREKTSIKKSNSPVASNVSKAASDYKSKEVISSPQTTDQMITDSGKPKPRPRSRSRSRGDKTSKKPRRSSSLSKRRRTRSRSRSKGRRRSPKRSPIRRRRSLSKRRQSPRRRLSDDKTRPNRRVEPSKRAGRRSTRSSSTSSSSSSSSN